jgi:hypothetical protein
MNLISLALEASKWRKDLEKKSLLHKEEAQDNQPVDGLKTRKLFKVVNNVTGEVKWV